MVHKIWERDTGDKETGTIRDILISCFQELHLDPPETTNKEQTMAINLIK
jgi:hypothetical protein